jgi:hypothetical protein
MKQSSDPSFKTKFQKNLSGKSPTREIPFTQFNEVVSEFATNKGSDINMYQIGK